jgi:hypothetical protein
VSQRAVPALPFAGRVFVAGVGTAGAAVFLWSAATLASQHVRLELWLFFALTLVSGHFTLKIPSIDSSLSVSEMFAFSCVLLFGAEAAACMMALDSLVLAYRRRMHPVQAFFNFGNLCLAVWVSGVLFFAVSGATPLIEASASLG